MTEPIGYQDGIAAFIGWLRKQPGVPPRGPGYDKADLSTWPWPDKLERTLRKLKDDHDAAAVEPAPAPLPPPPPPPSPPPAARLAPMTHYAAPGADARFCVRSPGVTNTGVGDHPFVDEGGFRYTENGMCAGGRSGKFVAVLKPANSMDGMEPCDGYTKDGRRFPPWPPESYEV